jgi:GT2 family glycosyltransferase
MIKMPNSIYILIPVHNRRDTTLFLLETLNRSKFLDLYYIVIIDDGSTDGTSEAIAKLYPQVIILKGDGNLWWTGAIVKGMQFAMAQEADFLIWLNDDTIPYPDTLPKLIAICQENSRIIASAQCYGDNNLASPTYGAQIKRRISIRLRSTPLGSNQICDALSGNLVCFSRQLVQTIGYPDAKRAPHCQADIIYTYQGKKAGYIPTVIGDAIAICEMNPLDVGWINSPTNMLKRWKILGSPKSNLYPPAYLYYCQQFYGLLGIFPFLNVYLRFIILTALIWVVPTTWLKKVKHWKDQWF